jgi:predicted metalloendopeptidase
MLRTSVALLVAILCAGAAAAQSSSVGFSVDYLDRTVNACGDFYQFACGHWLNVNPVPPDRSRYNRISELTDRNARIVRGILEDAAAKGAGRTPNEQRIGDAYAACMDQDTIESRGAAPVLPLLGRIAAVRNLKDLLGIAASFTHDGFPSFLTLSAQPDPHDSTRFIATFGQGAMGLPDRDLYLKDDERSMMLRAAYLAHLRTMFEIVADAGSERPRRPTDRGQGVGGPVLSDPPDQIARRVMEVETAIARATLDRVALRDPHRRDNPADMAQLTALVPNVNLAAYLRDSGVPNVTRFNLLNPQYLRDINGALTMLPLASWKAYMEWRALDAIAPLLSGRFELEAFHFDGEILNGQQAMRPRWMRCSDAVAGQPGADALGDIVGQIFIEQHFGADAKARMSEIVDALRRSLRGTLSTLDWMSPVTRARAIAKLDAMNEKIGGADTWRDFNGLAIKRDDYAGNSLRIASADTQRQLHWIDQPVDRSIWLMEPQTVNAYYTPQLNEIVFPAGILQPPFFDPARDDAVNFGGAATMIGHEMSHGFDDGGRRFDAKGNLTDWWTSPDDAAFKQRAACVATQYSQYESIPGVKLNGNLTLGENVADNAGVRIAYYALMDVLAAKGRPQPIDGFTPEQRFFLAWGQLWCENATEQDSRRRVQEDPHATGRWRTNGVLQNMPEFRKAFGCSDGTPMAPATVCRVW